MFIPIANEVHMIMELARVGGPAVGICAVIGAGVCGFSSSEEGGRSEAIRHGFLGGGVLGFVLAISGFFTGLF